MNGKVRVRFAPSPTGGLHLGGIRTVLYNYLFAKQNDGEFILRIEDTDRSRYVEGAEQYIFDCLSWCGLIPDEGPHNPGEYGPYRQSERKELYRQYAEKLVAEGKAYYAFDSSEELETMRNDYKTDENPSPQYSHQLRGKMKNSLNYSEETVRQLLSDGTPHVIRIKIPTDETISFTDMIRGEVNFNSNTIDDKVLLKADGMPTYHLAVVVDDYLMKITHAFRGEEWLPSAPVHILLWKYLGWESSMPNWAHLPLIMGPEGKLSKRDGARYGFPVFGMNWTDQHGETTEGFRERGFLPEAFVNMLAMLGWNDGSGKELFTIDELVQAFTIERVHKSGAKFDYEKAKWFNHQWIQLIDSSLLGATLLELRNSHIDTVDTGMEHTDTPEYANSVVQLVKERCTLLPDLWEQSRFFFQQPQSFDIDSVKPKWTAEKTGFFESLSTEYSAIELWEDAFIEAAFKHLAADHKIKPGELQLPFRIMLVGGKFGPGVFNIAGMIGKEETVRRIRNGIELFAGE